MDGEAGNNSGDAGRSVQQPDEVVDGSSGDSEQQQRGDGDQGGGSGTSESGADGSFDGLTIVYTDAKTGDIVQYGRIESSDIERFMVETGEEENSEAVQVRSDDASTVPDFQLMFGTWSVVVVVILFACFGALCVNTLLRSLELKKR